MLRSFSAFVLLLLCMPALAQTAPVPAPVRVTFQTSAGNIVIALESERAPATARNFLRYVDARRYDGRTFYRAMRVGDDSGLIQAGISDPRRLYPPIAHEPTTRTGLSHVEGSVSMAHAGPGTARADFFIVVGNSLAGLDASTAPGGDANGFAVFGRVVEGMDVVRRILAAPVSPTAGEGAMRGQMLEPAIRIVTARRTP